MGEINQKNPEQDKPTSSARFAEGYYFALYCFEHPDEERRANALIADVDYELSPPVKPWSEENKRERLTSILRTMVFIAARELMPDDNTDTRLQQYCLEQWEVGRELAQDLIDDEPELGSLACPLQEEPVFQKILGQLLGNPRRSLSMKSLTPKDPSRS
ncbi:hypothetical protein DYH10_03290 [Candidatus Saccharibacteria bacterium CPR2]|nr:hypothetical protein [Candidatus Saccharibacteria bacterium CPR2]